MLRTNKIRLFIFLTFTLFATGRFIFADDTLVNILAMKPVSARIDGVAVFGGNWLVDADGVISVDGGDGAKVVFSDERFSAMTRGEVSVEMFVPTAAGGTYRNAGIILKTNDVAVGADAFVGYEIAVCPESKHVNVGLHRNNYVPLERPACDVAADRWCTLNVSFYENSFEIKLDGKLVTKFTDNSRGAIRSGGVGLRAWQRVVKYRNLRIKNLSTETSDWINVPFRSPDTSNGQPHTWSETLSTQNLPPIIFVTRHPLTQPHSVGNDIWMGKPTASGCSICVIEPANPSREIRTVFADPRGSIYDMNLSRDAKMIYFSYRQRCDQYWHLWQVGIDGNGLQRLTDGGYHDVSPCETATGDLIFVSTRRFGYTVCQPGPASNLHRLHKSKTTDDNSGNADGVTNPLPKISCVSMNTLSDFSPQMLSNGRVLFTRWEYIDRDLTFRQSLWTQNPDGTGYQLFFGNTIRDVGTFWQARQIPQQPNLFVATFAPHHGYPHGMIGLIDRNAGIEGEKGKGFFYVTTEVPSVSDHNMPWGYRDPFPLSDKQFLCSYGDGVGYYHDGKRRFGLYLLNRNGEKRLLYEDAEQSCFFPIPLIASPPIAAVADRVEPTTSDQLNKFLVTSALPLQLEYRYSNTEWLNMERLNYNVPTGTLILNDVNEGLPPTVERGKIVALRIMEQVRKTEDLVNRAYDQSPVMSYGTYYAKRDWGTVPIEPDGSAKFTVPALREIYLQGLDKDGREVFRMMSALQVMPDEHLSCIGCHENRDTVPAVTSRLTDAARKETYQPKSPYWLVKRESNNSLPDTRIFDYPTVVQPVLDKYCVKCHNGENAEGGYDLTGDKTRFFSMSYDNLLGRSRSYRQHDMTTGKMLPDEAAKGKPLVHFFWLLFTPSSVSEPFITGSYASRLTGLIDTDHHGVTMPLGERQKLYYWMDANVPYYSTYAHSRPNAPGRRDRFADPISGNESTWFAERFMEVYNRRCNECHGSFKQPEHRDWIGRYAWVNLTNPKQSPALTAHLPKEQAGRGIKTTNNEKLLDNIQDPDYKKMLDAIEEGKRIMWENPEADMVDFKNARAEP